MSPHGESRRGPNEEERKRGLAFPARGELPCIYFEKTCEVRRLRADDQPTKEESEEFYYLLPTCSGRQFLTNILVNNS